MISVILNLISIRNGSRFVTTTSLKRFLIVLNTRATLFLKCYRKNHTFAVSTLDTFFIRLHFIGLTILFITNFMTNICMWYNISLNMRVRQQWTGIASVDRYATRKWATRNWGIYNACRQSGGRLRSLDCYTIPRTSRLHSPAQPFGRNPMTTVMKMTIKMMSMMLQILVVVLLLTAGSTQGKKHTRCEESM